MLAQRGQLTHPLGHRGELLDRLRSRPQRRAAGFVGERDGDLDPHDPRQRLDRVALQRRQLVEAVEEDLIGAPVAGPRAQRVRARQA